MWYFEQRYRDDSGTLQSLKLPLREHIEELKRDDWSNLDIAVTILRAAKWVDCDCDKLSPSGVPIELLPVTEHAMLNDSNEVEYAIEELKRSVFNPINR